MKRTFIFLLCTMIISACAATPEQSKTTPSTASLPAETTQLTAETTLTASSTKTEISSIAKIQPDKENLGMWLKEFFDEYYSSVNGIEFTVIFDENGNYIFLDDSEEYPFYELVECNYKISEIEDILKSMLTGKMLESTLGSVSHALKEQDGKMYRYQSEMFTFVYDWHTVFPETYSVVEQTENSLTVTMEAWDNNYEQKKNATAVFELDNGIWKLASISYI